MCDLVHGFMTHNSMTTAHNMCFIWYCLCDTKRQYITKIANTKSRQTSPYIDEIHSGKLSELPKIHILWYKRILILSSQNKDKIVIIDLHLQMYPPRHIVLNQQHVCYSLIQNYHDILLSFYGIINLIAVAKGTKIMTILLFWVT